MHIFRDETKHVGQPQGGLAWSGIRVGMLVVVSALLSWTTQPGVWAAVFQIPAGDVPGLIAAIQAANANGEENSIILEAGTYTLTAVDNNTEGPNGLPSITSTLTLIGAGAEATILERAASAPPFRLMHVATTGTATLEALTLQGGQTPLGTSGGGIWNAGTVILPDSTLASNMAFGAGGGLFNLGGTVTLTHSTVTDNRALSGFIGEGGGLWNSGTLTLINSTVAHNTSDLSGGGIGNSGTLTLINSTVAHNSAYSPGPGGIGGGLWNSGTLTLINSTVAHNSASNPFGPSVAGGIAGPAILQNTILARNTVGLGRGPDCAGPIISLDHNLVGDPTNCAITLLPSDLTGEPGLGAFVDPGTPGQGRFPLRPSSPAIDAGDDAACPPTDQLDTPRRGPCDIGAIEFYPLVNDLVALGRLITAFDSTPLPGGPAGTFHITAEFANTGPQAISHPFAEVVDLTGGNRLLNAEGGPAGVGARLRPAESASTPLAPGATAIFEFIIGLQTLDPFTFLVDLLGDPQAAELAQGSRGAGQWPVW